MESGSGDWKEEVRVYYEVLEEFMWGGVMDFGGFRVGGCDLLDWIPETEYLYIYIKIIK